ncbi:MAG: hypothetical protein ACLFP8_06795 [Alphaproteobacteria bacterium]
MENVSFSHPALSDQMRCGILSNSSGQIAIIYDQTLEEPFEWAEYETSTGTLYLVHQDGTMQNLGLDIDGKMKENIAHGSQVNLLQIVEGKVVAHFETTLIIRDY